MRFQSEKIQTLRENRNWSRKELAQRIVATGHFSGFTHQRVQQLEKSDNASHRVICALCEVFTCKPAEFFCDEDDEAKAGVS
ncbi:MAG: helix-turn-helix domain-containing protein [Leptospirales bacterium]|jgi:transcriptional regulator with XRE-family HTH domain